MRIVTWNINSVRIRLDSIKDLISNVSPDVICLQEIKTENEFFPYDFFKNHGYIYQFVRGQKSYHGVAILSRIPIDEKSSLSFINEDSRHVSVRITDIELHNFYFPAGGDVPDPRTNSKFFDKLEYVESVAFWFNKNRRSTDNLVCVGDLNIASGINDVWSHKALIDVVSHTYMEQYVMAKLMKSVGFVDAIRNFVPESERIYTWWSYRNPNWKTNDKGRRLDHVFTTKSLQTRLESYMILKEMRNSERTSDHVPVIIDIKV